LELDAGEKRLTCLIHKSTPHSAGLLDGDLFSSVQLKDFPVLARQMEGARCTLTKTDAILVLLIAVQFRHRPALQATTELVDPNHVLEVLAREGQDAALVLERGGARSLLFLQKGTPARLYFGRPDDDPGQGDPRERFLVYSFNPSAGIGKLEVYKKLNIDPDPDAGVWLARLAEAAKPPPPVTVQVRFGSRVVLQRPFMPPAMTIGRDHLCELMFDNLSISRRHARLSWERGQFMVEDLLSINGTMVNDKTITRSPVEIGDRIQTGKYEITLSTLQEQSDPNYTIMMPAKQVQAQAFLVGAGMCYPLGVETTIGKAPGVNIRVKGWFIKPVHAYLLNESPGSFKMLCSNGARVIVNGAKTDSCLLNPGDEIRIGQSRFKLTLDPDEIVC
jgi:pSer/pThr/pTyr-binding forkhead associated (FHA) protein